MGLALSADGAGVVRAAKVFPAMTYGCGQRESNSAAVAGASDKRLVEQDG